MEEQIEHLRAQLDTLTERTVEVDRGWGELRAEVDGLAAWRERAESMTSSFRSALEEFRLRLEEIPDQVRQALSDLADGFSSIELFVGDQGTLSPPGLRQSEATPPSSPVGSAP